MILAAGIIGFEYYKNAGTREAQNRQFQQEMIAQRMGALENQANERQRLAEIEKSGDFFEKLHEGVSVNILIVGDSIGAGSGGTDGNRWFQLLQREIKNTYGVNCNITNVSMGGNASYAGYVRTMALEDGIDYDLAIICYGQNDSPENFDLYYETILRAVRCKYENCNMIAVLESSQRDYTEKMRRIQEICAHYDVPVADTIGAFNASGFEYSALSDDGVHPNDAGYKIYFETIDAVIAAEYARTDCTIQLDIEPLNSGIYAFDTFRYVSAAEFERTDDLTFTISCSVANAIMGIDYSYQSGENVAEIYVDGQLYAAPTVTFNHDFSQRHILIVTSDATVRQKIELHFNTKDAADSFKGLIFSGYEQ